MLTENIAKHTISNGLNSLYIKDCHLCRIDCIQRTHDVVEKECVCNDMWRWRWHTRLGPWFRFLNTDLDSIIERDSTQTLAVEETVIACILHDRFTCGWFFLEVTVCGPIERNIEQFFLPLFLFSFSLLCIETWRLEIFARSPFQQRMISTVKYCAYIK